MVKRGEGPTKEWDRLWITGGSAGIGKVAAAVAEKEGDDVDRGDEDEGLGFEVGFWFWW